MTCAFDDNEELPLTLSKFDNVRKLVYFLEAFCSKVCMKDLVGPGPHLRPVHADHARPPFQWTLNSVFSAYEHNSRRIRPPPDRGTLKVGSRLLIAQEKAYANHPFLQT